MEDRKDMRLLPEPLSKRLEHLGRRFTFTSHTAQFLDSCCIKDFHEDTPIS